MESLSRRLFLKLAAGGGAGIAGGLGSKSTDRLIPHVFQPEHVKPGIITRYATTCRECPAGCGMHGWHIDGRVIKVEGNPAQPVSRGGLCARGQSSVQGLYDPDRLVSVLRREDDQHVRVSWDDALRAVAEKMHESRRVVLLSDLQTGTLRQLMQQLVEQFDGTLLMHEAFDYAPLRQAHAELFGRAVIPDYRLEQCELVLSFAADFLETWISNVRYARGFARMHEYRDGAMGRCFYAGPRRSMTAANADENVLTEPGAEASLALAILHSIDAQGLARREVPGLRELARPFSPQRVAVDLEIEAVQIEKIARRFVESSASIALAGAMGASGPAARDACVAAALLNYVAGRIGQTVDFGHPCALSDVDARTRVLETLESLTEDDLLIVHNTNPVFTLPQSAKALQRAGMLVFLGTQMDETGALADWVLPVDSPLESWGDYEPISGVHALLQPTMRRLFDTRAAGDVLVALAGLAERPLEPNAPRGFRARLEARWRKLHHQWAPDVSFDDFWRRARREGGVWPEELAPTGAELQAQTPTVAVTPPVARQRSFAAEQADLWLWPSIYLFDGRLANRGWLQENPHPLSTIAWGSWIDIHPKRAEALGVKDGNVLELQNESGSVKAPARITEEVHPNAAALALGQGHTRLGALADGVGVNGFELMAPESKAREPFTSVTLRKTGEHDPPVYLSATRSQHERPLLEWVTLSKLRTMSIEDAEEIIWPTPRGFDPSRDLYPPHPHIDHRWAMVIDAHRCIGCQACAVACYAENNIALVGKRRCREGREMAWLKVVPYLSHHGEKQVGFLPLPCQHCDAAPCEPVCPVYAAVHNREGLNAQVYNRCIGTRYCSNNCPYKVRRFNWFNPAWPEPLNWQLNPDVTVRSRGVMEKCSYCIQRIRRVEYRAKLENRPVRDGEVQPACVDSCPTRVFTFGDLQDPTSEVRRIIETNPRRYQLLHELNTKTSVIYLKRIHVDDVADA